MTLTVNALATCPECGAAWVKRTGTLRTLVGYGAKHEGHDHDDNCLKRGYECAAGHRTAISIRRRCPRPDCDWAGKDHCFCHEPDPKVDAWPTGDVEVVSGIF